MEFTYSSRISSLVYCFSMAHAMNASAALRVSTFSCVKYRFLASCWVMVLPPSTKAPAHTSFPVSYTHLDVYKRQVEAGKVNCIVTKDLSRFGREHVMMDYYLEFLFPEKRVRYIAVAENEDTEKGLSDFVPFKNLFNEWFAKDTSRKVKAAFKAKFATGQRIGCLLYTSQWSRSTTSQIGKYRKIRPQSSAHPFLRDNSVRRRIKAVSYTHLDVYKRQEKAQYNPSLKLAVDISRTVEAPIEEIFIFE